MTFSNQEAATVDTKKEAKMTIPEPSSAKESTVRLGAWLLIGTFSLFLLWAAFAPLDEGVPAPATVMIDTKRKTIQHLTGGLITKVFVREGQIVNAGDVLIKLDDAQAKTDYEGARHRYLNLRAMESRLLAEQQGKTKVSFHQDVVADKNDPLINQHIVTQEQLFTSRRLALRSELDSMTEAMRSQQEAATGYAAQLDARKQQAALIKEELDGLRQLVSEGYAPRNKQLEIERLAADNVATLSELQANLARAKRSASELLLRKTQREQEYRKEVDTQLADTQRELQADDERFKFARDTLARTEIKAPVSGAVIGIATQTIGGVIPAGARIMDIVPETEPLLLEAHLPPHLIDKVHVGQFADIRFSNFLQTPILVVEGKLESVSADLLTDPATNLPYYLARLAVTQDGMKSLGNNRLQPGMPAEVIVKTGERTLLAYLMHPLLRRVAQAMTEH